MNRGMWKRNLRRGAALALTLVMSLSIAACGAAQERLAAQAAGNAGGAGVKVHEAVPCSQRPYEHYDPAVMEQAMADFEQACAVEGRDEEVLRLYDAIVDEYDRLATLTYMAQLKYDADVSDEQAAAEQAYTTDIYSEMGDKAAACLKKGMNSSYKEVLTDKMGIENAPYIEYYRENTGELTELNRKEQELLREYDKLAAGDFTVELEGGQWSYSRLEREPDLDVSHLFYSPLYYMGYGTSALSALDLWTMSRSDWDGAVDTYMGLLHEGLDAPYCGTMNRCGLRDVFDSRELESLAGDVRRLQGLEQDGEGSEVPSQEDAGQAGTDLEGSSDSGLRVVGLLVLAGICVILIFQVMILCTGFVIIWLIVRKKREE